MATIGVDLADIYVEPGDREPERTLAFGDRVELLDSDSDGYLKVRAARYPERSDGSVEVESFDGYVRVPGSLTAEDIAVTSDPPKVLRVDFVDVQQGDAAVIETPEGKTILVDGGDNQLFARYLAARYRGTDVGRPKEIDCILVSHGDADHFAGLTEIHRSEENETESKRIWIEPRRVFHNGLVKRPSSLPEMKQLGPTSEVDGELVLTGLEEDLLAVPDEEMNEPFREWKEALASYAERNEIEFRRLSRGTDEAFSFLTDEEIEVEVLGPIETPVGSEPGLAFLREPPTGPIVDAPSVRAPAKGSLSASHTINGHSVVFRLRFGSWRFLFAGDLNESAGEKLAAGARDQLTAEVFKVPHHGSADFSEGFFGAVSPLVSVISSGDESARKEYIHPRATLMSALGRNGRSQESVMFVTELVAFFAQVGWSKPCDSDKPNYYGFRRAAWGLVKVRTDGSRLLVYTNSASARLKEAYACEMVDGVPRAVPVVKV